MDNTVPSVTTPTPNNSADKKKLFTIGGAILAIIVFAVIGYLGFQMFNNKSSYEFTINEYAVPEAEFQEVYAYYQESADQGEDPLTQAQNVFIQNYVLNAEYTAQGNTPEQLTQLISAQPAPTGNDLPPTLLSINTENSVIKAAILPSIGVNMRTGEVLQLVASNSAEGTQEVMTTVLQDYKERFDTGESFDELKVSFAQDPTLIAQPAITRNVLNFENMSPNHPILPGQEFATAAFETPANGMSQVFTSTIGNKTMSGLVYITSATDGSSDGYQNWLSQKVKAVKVTFKL